MNASYGSALSVIVALVATTVLTACGAGSGSPAGADAADDLPIHVSLTTASSIDTKTGTIGRNYVDMSKPWTDWTGAPSRVLYDSTADELIIPAPASGEYIVLGVQRYEMKLGARRYSLNIDSASWDVAALIFVYDASGQILSLNDQEGPFVARPGQPFRFDGPADAVGYFVQIQSGWQASSPVAVQTRLNDIGIVLGNNLIDPRGPWTTWDGAQAKVSFNALINRIAIQPPEPGEPLRYGVQRYANPLIAGQTYELSVIATSTAGASVLLFLIDADGALIPFTDQSAGTEQAWLAVTSQSDEPLVGAPSAVSSVQFVAPANVAEVAVQVQGAWNSAQSAGLFPALQLVTSE